MHATADDLQVLMADDAGGSIRSAEWGEMATNINRLAPGTDFGPVLVQLSTGGCPVPHWGYVIDGAFEVGYQDGRSETVSAGEVFHLPAGHDGLRSAQGALYVELSPGPETRDLLAELGQVLAGG